MGEEGVFEKMAGQEILDTRILTKPRVFAGEKTDWKRFEFQLKAYLQVLSPKVVGLMNLVESENRPISQSADVEVQSEDLRLHAIMSMLLGGGALEELMNCQEGRGLNCWLRLCQIHKPMSAGHQRAQLSKLLSPVHILGTFDERIAKWERELRDYHATSSEIPPGIKMSV